MRMNETLCIVDTIDGPTCIEPIVTRLHLAPGLEFAPAREQAGVCFEVKDPSGSVRAWVWTPQVGVEHRITRWVHSPIYGAKETAWTLELRLVTGITGIAMVVSDAVGDRVDIARKVLHASIDAGVSSASQNGISR